MQNYILEVLVRGRPLPKYVDPNNKEDLWIEGREGTKYELRITNNSPNRVKAVVTVDGLSVISGEVANLQSPGYIIDARNSVTIPGWSLDNKQVAKFTFSNKENSYSAAVDNATDTGVLGLAIFQEKQEKIDHHLIYRDIVKTPYIEPYLKSPYWLTDSLPLYNTSIPRGTASSTASNIMQASLSTTAYSYADIPEQTLGTGFGETADFLTKEVKFEQNSSTPSYTEVIYYGTEKTLERLGIVPVWKKKHVKRPNAFPGTVNNYCRKPEDWK